MPFVALLILPGSAANAYSYDDLVRLSQAEQRVFAHADMSQSVDDRVRNLELNLFGGSQQGTDSSRVRRICRRVGIPYPEPEKPAATQEIQTEPQRREQQFAKKVQNPKKKLKDPKANQPSEQASAQKNKTEKKIALVEIKPAVATTNKPIVTETKESSPAPSSGTTTDYVNPLTKQLPTENTTSSASTNSLIDGTATATATSTDPFSRQTSTSSSTSTTPPERGNLSSDPLPSFTPNNLVPTKIAAATSPTDSTTGQSPALANALNLPPVQNPDGNANPWQNVLLIPGIIMIAFIGGAGIMFFVLKPQMNRRSSEQADTSHSTASSNRSIAAKKVSPDLQDSTSSSAAPQTKSSSLSNLKKPILIGASALSAVGLAVAAYFIIPSADNEKRAAEAAYEKQDYNNAILHINKALEFDPKRNDLHVMKGRILTSSGNGEAAVEELSKVLGSEPLNPDALFYRAEGYRAIQNYTRAIDDYNELVKRNEHTLDSYLWLGKLYCQTRQFDKSKEMSNKALAMSPGNAVALWNLGLVAKENAKYKEAVAYLDDAYSKNRTLKLHGDRGFCLYMLGRFEQASKELKQATEDNPSDLDSRNWLSRVYDAMGKYRDAVDQQDYVVNRNSQNQLYQDTMKLVCHNLESQSRETLRFRPRDAEAHANLALALYNQKDFVNALDSAKTAIDLRPNDANNYYIAGNCQYSARKLPDAINYFSQALSIQPSWNHCRFDYARALTANKDFHKAIAVYTDLINRGYSKEDCYRNRGDVYYRLYDADKAIGDLEKSLEIQPNDSAAWDHLGDAYSMKMEPQKAIECFKNCLKLDPKNASPLFSMAYQQLQLRDYAAALETLETYKQNNPDYAKNSDYFSALVRIYLYKDDLARAVEESAKVCSLESDDSNFLVDALVNMAADKPDRVRSSINKISSQNNADFYSLLLWVTFNYLNENEKSTKLIKATESRLKQEDWPAPAIHLYAGSLSMEDYLRKYENDPTANQTEFHAYAGFHDYYTGRKEEARKHLAWVKSNGDQTYLEMIPALSLLKKL